MSKINMNVDVSTGELIDGLTSSLSREELFDFIVYLDATCAEWEFTQRLHEHFAAEVSKADEESNP